MAISRYSVVQTGPNTQLGGVSGGFANPAYHAPGMNSAPNAAAPKHTPRQIPNRAADHPAAGVDSRTGSMVDMRELALVRSCAMIDL
jgi:hypothetical protein